MSHSLMRSLSTSLGSLSGWSDDAKASSRQTSENLHEERLREEREGGGGGAASGRGPGWMNKKAKRTSNMETLERFSIPPATRLLHLYHRRRVLHLPPSLPPKRLHSPAPNRQSLTRDASISRLAPLPFPSHRQKKPKQSKNEFFRRHPYASAWTRTGSAC
jgi:hypothetical protein